MEWLLMRKERLYADVVVLYIGYLPRVVPVKDAELIKLNLIMRCRASESQENDSKQEESNLQIWQEILEYLIEQNKNDYPELVDLYHSV